MLACVVGALALSAAPAGAAEGCPNEALREQSRVNPATGQPYSLGLPDCRAYEMVSPPYKQSRDASAAFLEQNPSGFFLLGFPVSPDGDTAGFWSEGAFSEPESNQAGLKVNNFYTSQRGASGWTTSSAFPPANLIPIPFGKGLSTDFSPDLRSLQVGCGLAYLGKPEGLKGALLCARREAGGSWVPTPRFTSFEGASVEPAAYLGASADLSRVFIKPESPYLPTIDKLESGAGLYEISGVGTGSATLRLVNVGRAPSEENGLTICCNGGKREAPLLGDRRESPNVKGTDYHAISENGETVFFTAQKEGQETLTIFARVGCVTGPRCRYVKKVDEEGRVTEEGETGIAGTGRETVAVSDPKCTPEPCKVSTPASPTFQGASADGKKVFFTTAQQLLNEDTNTETDLYEYEFNPNGDKLTLISKPVGGEGHVNGVVRTSSDGSHVYFIDTGVLTKEPNKNGEKAEAGKENLYGYDTETEPGKIKFVAQSSIRGLQGLFGQLQVEESTDVERHAQTTPDGRYLVFSSPAQVAGDLNKVVAANETQAVYLYDFETGELIWISHGAPGFKVEDESGEQKEREEKYKGEGEPAFVSPLPGSSDGAEVDAGDWNRAISDNGEYVIFSTTEKLQADDENEALDVYEWHRAKGETGHGKVRMISDGHNRESKPPAYSPSGISASGSDIFFFTHSPLVGQDTGVLGDLYDARVNGGFPAPVAEPSCSGEQCQGTPTPPPSFGSAPSAVFPAGGNLSPPALPAPPPPTAPKLKPKPLTRAQQLAKALKACRGKPKKSKKKRAACEAQARKRFGGKTKAKKAASVGKSEGGIR
jgi:hypothetical protein